MIALMRHFRASYQESVKLPCKKLKTNIKFSSDGKVKLLKINLKITLFK